MQERRNSIANALELCLSSINTSICICMLFLFYTNTITDCDINIQCSRNAEIMSVTEEIDTFYLSIMFVNIKSMN